MNERNLFTQEETAVLFNIAVSYICKIAKRYNIKLKKYEDRLFYDINDVKKIENHLFLNRQGIFKSIHNYLKEESVRLQADFIIPVKLLKEHYELNSYDLSTILADITEIDDRLYEEDNGKIFYACESIVAMS